MAPINFEEQKYCIETLMSEWHIPGLSIAVFDKEDVTATAFGLASIEPEVAVTPDSIFDLASTSKSLIAAAVAKLVADDQKYPGITWSTPVSELLQDEFVLSDANATASVTVEDILSHRSGIPGHDGSYMGQQSQNSDDPKSITNNLRNLPMSAPLRTKYQYCNMTHTVAGYLVENKSQKTFDSFVREHFLDPLGMNSTYFRPGAVLAAGQGHRIAQPYIWRDDSKKHTKAEKRDQPEGTGAGLMQSTASDYAKWGQTVMNRNESLLLTEAYEQLVQGRIGLEKTGEDDTIAPFTTNQSCVLGWGYRLVRHGGAEPGYSNIVAFLSELQFGLVILSNAGNVHDVIRAIVMGAIDKILNVPPEESVDWVAWVRKESAPKDQEGDSLKKLRSELLNNSSVALQALSLLLTSYTGIYSNAGYHQLVVSLMDGNLYIDASDRCMQFTIKFEHVRDDRIFIRILQNEYGTSNIKAEFKMDQDGRVQSLGLDLREEISPSLIWFTKEE
jgi:CubicO group peptidase (beta-lactamase class C family)